MVIRIKPLRADLDTDATLNGILEDMTYDIAEWRMFAVGFNGERTELHFAVDGQEFGDFDHVELLGVKEDELDALDDIIESAGWERLDE